MEEIKYKDDNVEKSYSPNMPHLWTYFSIKHSLFFLLIFAVIIYAYLVLIDGINWLIETLLGNVMGDVILFVVIVSLIGLFVTYTIKLFVKMKRISSIKVNFYDEYIEYFDMDETFQKYRVKIPYKEIAMLNVEHDKEDFFLRTAKLIISFSQGAGVESSGHLSSKPLEIPYISSIHEYIEFISEKIDISKLRNYEELRKKLEEIDNNKKESDNKEEDKNEDSIYYK